MGIEAAINLPLGVQQALNAKKQPVTAPITADSLFTSTKEAEGQLGSLKTPEEKKERLRSLIKNLDEYLASHKSTDCLDVTSGVTTPVVVAEVKKPEVKNTNLSEKDVNDAAEAARTAEKEARAAAEAAKKAEKEAKIKAEKEAKAAEEAKNKNIAAKVKSKEEYVSSIAKNLFLSMKGTGTKNELLKQSISCINKNNVIEVMNCWNKNYSSSMDGETLVQSINNDVYFGEEDYINPIAKALSARAKDEGLTVKADAFMAKVQSEQDCISTDDDKIESAFAELSGNFKDTEKVHLTKSELAQLGYKDEKSDKKLTQEQINAKKNQVDASEYCKNFYVLANGGNFFRSSATTKEKMDGIVNNVNKDNVVDFFTQWNQSYNNGTDGNTVIGTMSNLKFYNSVDGKDSMIHLCKALTEKLKEQGHVQEADAFEAKVNGELDSVSFDFSTNYDSIQNEFAKALSLIKK